MKNERLSAVAFLLVAGVAIAAQSNDPFEVASVKPNKSGSNRVNINPQPGGRFTAINVSAMDLIAVAYGDALPFPRSNILNAPSWVSRDRFDVVAKATGDPAREQVVRLLRGLLDDRFQLKVHGDTRERPIYTLMLARRDGALGPALRRSTLDCSSPRGPDDPVPSGCERVNVPGTLTARGTTLVLLTRFLSSSVDDHRDVRDETGLTGIFDMDLHWTPTVLPVVPPDATPELAQALRSIDPNGPSLFTALQEQLGLRLVPGKDQIDVLVIDHVEPPSPD